MKRTVAYWRKLWTDPALAPARNRSTDNLLLAFALGLSTTIVITLICYYLATKTIPLALIGFLMVSLVLSMMTYRFVQAERRKEMKQKGRN